jgi:hypothetical protein
VLQAYRSIAPESLFDAVPGAEFDVVGVGADHKLFKQLYLGWSLDWLRSEGDNRVGIFAGSEVDVRPTLASQRLGYDERSISVYAHQLLGEQWSIGLRYQLSAADATRRTPHVSASIWPEANLNQSADLHQLTLFGTYNHVSGFYARLAGRWVGQDNHQESPGLEDDSFVQLDAFLGYRFARRKAEVSLGLLNITDQDYRLSPVNLHPEFARERTLATTARFNF